MKSIFILDKPPFSWLNFLAIALLLTFSWSPSSPAAEDDTDVFGVAIQGYDTVAYFTMHQAVRGIPGFYHDWNEARWYFSSAKHRDMFAAEPEKYAPNHGGF